jgi:hypothetical protein
MATTFIPNHEAQMRETFISVTAGHHIAFKGLKAGDDFHQDVTVPVSSTRDAPIFFTSIMRAVDIKREAEGATAALLARVFPKAGAL